MRWNPLHQQVLWSVAVVWSVVLFAAPAASRAEDKVQPISIADVKHEGPVDFEKEILPILRRSCLACHNATNKESDLVLESPAAILKGGGEGPSVVPGKPAESLLLQLAAHQKEPVMPPKGNDVKARNMTPEELGLLKLWIEQGAKGEVTGASAPIKWQSLPPGVTPIFAVAVTGDGQYAAAGRANQIFIYHVPSKREVGRLTDPALLTSGVYKNPGVAHLDLVQALDFNPAGDLLASGGYREVKLWRRQQNVKAAEFAGLEGAPRSLALSGDGKWAAIGDDAGKIKVYDVSNGQPSKVLAGHTGPVTGLRFTADNARLVSGSHDKTVRVWNLADGAPAGQFETAAPINALALVAEGKQIATGGADNVIRLWDYAAATAAEKPAEPLKPVKEIPGHGGPVTSLAILAANGAELVSGSADGTIRVWNVAQGNAVRQMNHGGPVEAIAVRADGQRIASVSANNSAKLWNATNGQQTFELKGDFRAKIKVDEVTRAVALAKRNVDTAKKDLDEANKRKTAEEENAKKSDEALKKADEDFKKKDEAAKQPVADKEAADKALAEATAAKTKAEEAKKAADEAAPKANEALTKAKTELDNANKAATDAANAAKAAAEKFAKATEAAKADANNQGLADAAKAAEKESQDAEAKSKAAAEAKTAAETTFQAADAAKKAADEAKKKGDEEFNKANTALTQADQKVKQVTPVATKAVDEKNAADRALKAAQRGLERAKEAVVKATEALPMFDASVKQAEEGVKQAEANLEAEKKAAAEMEKPIRTVAFSPDGLTVATGGDDQMVHTWDVETGAPIERFQGQGANPSVLAYLANDRLLSGAANKTAVVWSTAIEWKLERTIGNPDMGDKFTDRVTALDFSPDGKVLATGGGEPSRSGEVKFWNVENGELISALKDPHSDTVFGLEFSPDGKIIASCGADRFVKLHQVADGKFVRSFEGHTHHVLGVSWRADGRVLASCGADTAIKVWDVRTGDQQRTIQGFGKEVTSIRFVADTDNVVASSGDKTVQLKNSANGGNAANLGGAGDYMYSAAATGDGKLIIGGGQDSVVRVWNANGQPFVSFEAPKPQP
ncbi:MAG: c-type cytochrome domain-containing protein [Pirellulales bacterium]